MREELGDPRPTLRRTGFWVSISTVEVQWIGGTAHDYISGRALFISGLRRFHLDHIAAMLVAAKIRTSVISCAYEQRQVFMASLPSR